MLGVVGPSPVLVPPKNQSRTNQIWQSKENEVDITISVDQKVPKVQLLDIFRCRSIIFVGFAGGDVSKFLDMNDSIG